MFGSGKGTGGPPGLQIRRTGWRARWVGSIPMRFRQIFNDYSKSAIKYSHKNITKNWTVLTAALSKFKLYIHCPSYPLNPSFIVTIQVEGWRISSISQRSNRDESSKPIQQSRQPTQMPAVVITHDLSLLAFYLQPIYLNKDNPDLRQVINQVRPGRL